MRIQGQYVRVTPQIVQRVADVPGRQRADPAQVLSQDQVGIQPGQRPRVQGVQVTARGQLRAHVPVDVPRGHPAGVPAADHDRLLRAGGGGLVTLERDPG
jgi:hypothetical protein